MSDRRARWACVLVIAATAVSASAQNAVSITPIADHHQHLFSPAIAAIQSTPTRPFEPITARDVVAWLDSAGIQKALVLSVAYMYARPDRNFADEQARVRAENEWTAEQVAQYPGRLFAACSVNPIEEYALEEIAYCAKHPELKRALKLHFGNSDVRTDSTGQLEQLKRVFRAANEQRMANVWFDATAVIDGRITPANAQKVADQIRKLGPQRVLYGTDASVGAAAKPREAWAAFRRIPLTDAEFRTIAANVPPHMR